MALNVNVQQPLHHAFFLLWIPACLQFFAGQSASGVIIMSIRRKVFNLIFLKERSDSSAVSEYKSWGEVVRQTIARSVKNIPVLKDLLPSQATCWFLFSRLGHNMSHAQQDHLRHSTTCGPPTKDALEPVPWGDSPRH
ncbi:hypothetical protein BKA82DRAFT_999471 [Pisolithus tinctorius]|nr:hypothetical protein BKA82DRAFT_999471 [Pisolithus tinctorius]